MTLLATGVLLQEMIGVGLNQIFPLHDLRRSMRILQNSELRYKKEKMQNVWNLERMYKFEMTLLPTGVLLQELIVTQGMGRGRFNGIFNDLRRK